MKTFIQSGDAPDAIGPYSQGVRARHPNSFFFPDRSGWTRKQGELVPGDIEVQTERVLKNLEEVLRPRAVHWVR